PLLPGLLRVRQGGRSSSRGEGLARTHSPRHGRPPVAAGFRALGSRAWSGAEDRPGAVAPARSADDQDVDPRLAERLRRRSAGPNRDPALRPAVHNALAAADRGRVLTVRGWRPDRRLSRGQLRPSPYSLASARRDEFIEI